MYAYQLIEMLSQVDPNTEICKMEPGATGELYKAINSWDFVQVTSKKCCSYRERVLDVNDLENSEQVLVLY